MNLWWDKVKAFATGRAIRVEGNEKLGFLAKGGLSGVGNGDSSLYHLWMCEI